VFGGGRRWEWQAVGVAGGGGGRRSGCGLLKFLFSVISASFSPKMWVRWLLSVVSKKSRE